MDFAFLDDAGGGGGYHHPAATRQTNIQQQPHQPTPDYDALFTQVQELQACNYQQSSYIEELESRIHELEATKLPAATTSNKRRRSNDNDNTTCCSHCGRQLADDTNEEAAATAVNMPPMYGRRETPITTERGMIDGRSNAKLAFDEKCERLREFQEEFGHLAIGSNPPEKRQKFREYKRGVAKTPVEIERFAQLQAIGLDLTPHLAIDEQHRAYFDTMLPKVVAFKEVHGHCCVLAVEGKDSELSKFVETQRSCLRKYRRVQQQKEEEEAKQANGDNDSEDVVEEQEHTDAGDNGGKENDDTQNAAAATTSTTTEGAQVTTEEGRFDGQGTEVETGGESSKVEDGGGGGEDIAAPGKRKRKKRSPSTWQAPPKWFSDSMREELEALEDPYFSVDDDSIFSLFKTLKEKAKVHRGASPHIWYQNLEAFRVFFKEHGHGHVPLLKNNQLGLQGFVRGERKIFNCIRDKMIDSHPILAHRIELLESSGFIFDAEILKKESDRLLAIAVEKNRREAYMKTAQYRLEQVQERAESIKKDMQEARKQEKDAKARIAAIGTQMSKVRKEVLAAKAEADKDPIGSKVFVRSRGETKPGGSGKITRHSQVKVLAETIQYYDVKFADGRKEVYVESRYVTFENDAAALLGLSRGEGDKPQPPQLSRPGTRSTNKGK